MSYKAITFTAVILSLSAVSTKAAAPITGNDLHRWCSGTRLMVLGYVSGVTDMTGFLRDPVCLPDSVTMGQINDVVCKWIDDNPKERNRKGAQVTLMALRDAWPCRP